jgi:hypothetical protein
MTIEVKNAQERVTSLILKSDGRWEYDDSNYTDLPIATTSIVSGQQDYSLAVSHLNIDRLEIQDNGTTPQRHKLKPIDQSDLYDTAMAAFLNTSGLPVYYDKLGASVFLYPTPNYSQSASLKIFFKRGPLNFDYTTGKFTDGTGSTSSTPGFNSLYHDLIPLWVAYNFALANGKENGPALMNEITMREDALREDYALRSKDDTPSLQARPMRWQ